LEARAKFRVEILLIGADARAKGGGRFAGRRIESGGVERSHHHDESRLKSEAHAIVAEIESV
jgi:hypothetical protein